MGGLPSAYPLFFTFPETAQYACESMHLLQTRWQLLWTCGMFTSAMSRPVAALKAAPPRRAVLDATKPAS